MKRILAAARRRRTDARWPPARSTRSLESGDTVNVVIGYQSKTINTVTAGTLLRAQGYLEQRLDDITKHTGHEVQRASGRTTTPVRRSPRRWSPRRSTSARWATTRC